MFSTSGSRPHMGADFGHIGVKVFGPQRVEELSPPLLIYDEHSVTDKNRKF